MLFLFFVIICFVIGFISLFYILINKAVKNGVIEALEEYHSKDDCE